MAKIIWPITIVTSCYFFYLVAPAMGFSADLIISMYLASPLLIIWMVFKILKAGTPSDRTFDEFFYEDIDYKRNNHQ